jgi:transposase
MRTATSLAAVGATILAVPTAAHAQADVRTPLAGHLSVRSQMQEQRREQVNERLTARATRLRERLADKHDRGFSPHRYRTELRGDSTPRLARRVRALRRELARKPAAPAAPPVLEAIAACESGGNPATDTGNGFYGKYQFTAQTWASVGGTGNPAQAGEAEQDRRAAALYAREGASPWPVCGR